jgi:hypothetical protein
LAAETASRIYEGDAIVQYSRFLTASGDDFVMSVAKNTYTVFISSTFIDNEERRKVVEDAVLRAGMRPVGMEHFTECVHPLVAECERQARECDIYLGIIAHRYGWIPEGQTLSITELEYDAAKAAERPRLIFVIDESVPIDKRKDYDEGPERWAKQEKLDDFRAKYRQDQTPMPYKEATLSGMVVQALNRWRDEQEGASPDAVEARSNDSGASS